MICNMKIISREGGIQNVCSGLIKEQSKIDWNTNQEENEKEIGKEKQRKENKWGETKKRNRVNINI